MKIVTPCPHCRQDVPVTVDHPRQYGHLRWASTVFVLTLASAMLGCWLVFWIRDVQLGAAIKRAEAERQAEEERLRDERMKQIMQRLRDQ